MSRRPPVNPWFKFYPRDFLLSRKVQSMSREEIGWYLLLLSHQWLEGSLPKELSEIQSLFKVPSNEVQSVSNVVSMCFPLHGKVRMNRKLLAVKREQEQYYQHQQKAGQQGAKARWKDSTAMAPLYRRDNDPIANACPPNLIQSKLNKTLNLKIQSTSRASLQTETPGSARRGDDSRRPSQPLSEILKTLNPKLAAEVEAITHPTARQT